MARTALVALVAACLCSCDGELVNLGASAPRLGGGEAGSGGSGRGGSVSTGGNAASAGAAAVPALLFEQEDLLLLASPTFTANMQQIFYTQELAVDDSAVSIQQRIRQGGGPWSEPRELELGSVVKLDAASPAISADGQQLWFGQNVEGGLGLTDIWLSRLEGSDWGEPELVAELSSPSDDIPRPVAVRGTLMPLSSRRHGGRYYQIYLASRPEGEDTWQEVSAELLGTVNSSAFESVDGFLTDDGLSLYFSSTRSAGRRGDLFVAERASLQEAFGEPRALPEGINSAADERDPWLSTSGQLYFTSDRPTADYAQYSLYMSEPLP